LLESPLTKQELEKKFATHRLELRKMEFEDFQRDEKTIDAMIRNFIVIGEAARNIPDDISAKYPKSPGE
jgi:uncharacterized protein with HEPN domain